MALIRGLYAIEAGIRGKAPLARLAARQERSAPILARLDNRLRHHRARASTTSPLGETLASIAKYRAGLGRFLTDSRIEIDNNTPLIDTLYRLPDDGENARSALSL